LIRVLWRVLRLGIFVRGVIIRVGPRLGLDFSKTFLGFGLDIQALFSIQIVESFLP